MAPIERNPNPLKPYMKPVFRHSRPAVRPLLLGFALIYLLYATQMGQLGGILSSLQV